MQHSIAYICRCFGHGDVTAADVYAYRESTGRIETSMPKDVFGIAMEGFWQERDEHGERIRNRYWMGPHNRAWVVEHLTSGAIAAVSVHRIPTMAHVVVLLEADEETVLLMDPIYGMVREPWPWFLGAGARNQLCNRIDAWYFGHEPHMEAP